MYTTVYMNYVVHVVLPVDISTTERPALIRGHMLLRKHSLVFCSPPVRIREVV